MQIRAGRLPPDAAPGGAADGALPHPRPRHRARREEQGDHRPWGQGQDRRQQVGDV